MKMVKILKGNVVTEIPEAELAPGMVQADVEGIGLVYISVSDIDFQTEYQHPPFDRAIRRFINKKIARPLAEVRFLTLDQWEDGFRKDRDSEIQIGIWVRIADRYQRFIRARPFLNRAQRQGAFDVMVRCTLAGSPEQVLAITPLETLTPDLAKAAIQTFANP
jgi:hypothetical protein